MQTDILKIVGTSGLGAISVLPLQLDSQSNESTKPTPLYVSNFETDNQSQGKAEHQDVESKHFQSKGEYSETVSIVRTHLKEWTKKDENRFDHLLEKSLTDGCTSAEIQEFERLKSQRKRQLARPTNDELARRIRERALLRKLTQSLNEYIEFKKTSS